MKAGSVRHVFLFSLPMIISQACESLMMLTDRFILSGIDSISPAASMSGGMTFFLLAVFGVGLLSFITPLVAQFIGAGEADKAKSAVFCGLIVALILALPLNLFGGNLGKIYFDFLELPQEEYTLAVEYLEVLLRASLFVFLKVVIASYFSGVGACKTVMVVNMLGLILNIPLNYIFIYGEIGWSGIKGAAMATAISEVFVAMTLAGTFLKKYFNPKTFEFDSKILKKLLKFGTPTGVEFFVLTFAFNSFLTMFHSFGTHVAQAITITMSWAWLTILPFLGLNIGIMSLVGKAVGGKDLDLAHSITKSGLKIGVCIVFVASIGFLFFSAPLIRVFSNGQDEINSLAVIMLKTLPLYCLFDAISFVLTASLRAANYTKYCLYVGFMWQWGCMLLCFLGIYKFGYPPLVIWSIFIFALCGQACMYSFKYLNFKNLISF